MATAKQETPKATLQQQLDAITFKNAQVEKIKAMQEGKERLKDRTPIMRLQSLDTLI